MGSWLAEQSGVHTAAPAPEDELLGHGWQFWVLPVVFLKVEGGQGAQLHVADWKCPAAQLAERQAQPLEPAWLDVPGGQL